MTQYILLIQDNVKTRPTGEDWEKFFVLAQRSGLFRGGSEIGTRQVVGDLVSAQSTAHVSGYMRFDSDDRQAVLDLLKVHPVVLHGGSVELCEMPKS
jgi:hypothetical protein